MFRQKKSGFTLISLLVGIGIFGIVSLIMAAAVVNILKNKDSQGINTDIQSVITSISKRLDCCKTFAAVGSGIGSNSCAQINSTSTLPFSDINFTHNSQSSIAFKDIRDRYVSGAANKAQLAADGQKFANWFFWGECVETDGTKYMNLRLTNPVEKDALKEKDLTALKEYLPVIRLCSHILNGDANNFNYLCTATGNIGGTYLP